MTAKLFASQLDGREYPFELSRDEERIAQENRLLVVYAASDDLCELEGFTREEVGAPGLVCVTKEGEILLKIEDDDAEVLKRYGVFAEAMQKRSGGVNIESIWCEEPDGPSWTYRTMAPHETFNIMEEGEVYCRGLVIQL